MKRRLNTRVILGMASALLAVVLLAAGEPGEEPPEPSVPAAGLRVYLDPETGEVSNRPADPASRLEAWGGVLSPRDRLNTYGGDLLQERLPGGGFKVDLRGRFQSAVVATIDPETDTVKIDCVSTPAIGEVADDK